MLPDPNPLSSTIQLSQTYKNYTSACRVKIFHYVDPDPAEDADNNAVLKCEVIDLTSNDVDNPIVSFSYSKNNNISIGSFSLTLAPTANWLKRIRAGDWICVYMDNGVEGWHLRCLGNVDTVLMTENIVAETGARVARYNVNGSDFGKVFEKYNIYLHPFLISSLIEEIIIRYPLDAISGKPGEIITQLINYFLGTTGSGFSLLQWLIPTELSSQILSQNNNSNQSFSTPPKFHDLLDLTTIRTDLPGGGVVDLLGVKDTLWGLMKRYSNPYINELFCDLTDSGLPSVTFRTIPFTMSNFQAEGNIQSSIILFKDLPSLVVSGADILQSQISLTEQLRFNFTLLASTQSLVGTNPMDSISIVQPYGYPWVNKTSMKRYGMSIYEGVTDSSLGSDPNHYDGQMLVSWNHLIRHWQSVNPFVEGIQMLMRGKNGTRLGKRIDIQESPLCEGMNNTTRSYYIEGYTDSWTYPGHWIQTVIGTRGIFLQNGQEKFSYELMDDVHRITNASVYKR